MNRLADHSAAILRWVAGHRAAVLGFAVTAAYWPGMLSAAFAPRWAVIAIGVGLVSRLDPREVPEALRRVLAFLVALGAVSLLGSPDPRAGTMDLIFVAILCGAFLMGAGLKTFDDLMAGVGVGLLPSAMILMFGMVDDQGRGDTDAMAGLFRSVEVFAEFSALVLVWAVARFAVFTAAIAAIPVFVLNSRVAILAACIGLLAAYWPKSRVMRLGAVAGVVAVAVAMLFAFGMGKMQSADQRLVLWAVTIMSWTPFGNGLGWFQAVHPREEFSHSDALQMIAELGPLGVVSMLVPIYAFVTNRGTNAERALLTAGCVEIVFSFPLHTPAAGFLIAAVAGFMVGARGAVRMGVSDGRTENVKAIRRPGTVDHGSAGFGGRVGVAIPDRPVFARQEDVRSQANRFDPGARAIEGTA